LCFCPWFWTWPRTFFPGWICLSWIKPFHEF
jgi:hypothetical protein